MNEFDPTIVHAYQRDGTAQSQFRRRWAVPAGVAVVTIAAGALYGCISGACGRLSDFIPIALLSIGGVALASSVFNYYRTAICNGCGARMQHHRVPIAAGHDHIYVCHACRKYFGYTVESAA